MSTKPHWRVIATTFEYMETIYPDKSTEFLFAVTCDVFVGRIDHADIADALSKQQKEKDFET